MKWLAWRAWLSIVLGCALAHAQVGLDAGLPLDSGTSAEPASDAAVSTVPPPWAPLSPKPPSILDLVQAQPSFVMSLASGRKYRAPRRERFARTGAVLGAVSAGLVLGGAIAMAVADDPHSGKVTRGVWLSYTATGVPLVALSTWLARKKSKTDSYDGLRTIGWLGYGLALTDGSLLWANAFRDEHSPKLLSVSAGILGALAFLPHALDALTAARSIRVRRYAPVRASAGGLTVDF